MSISIMTLEIGVGWKLRSGAMGNVDAIHTAWFNDAVANANKIALSFGGDGWWAFGCGVTNGPANPDYSTPVAGGSAKATFLLYNFTAK